MRLIVFVSLIFLGMGCSGDRVRRDGEPAPNYRYRLGKLALADADYLESIRHFTFVKNKFAYSKFAALSELGIADTYFEQGKYIEAIDGYRRFTSVRPSHKRVAYAYWRAALGYYEQLPSRFVLFPPAHEKDQATTRQAYTAFRRYVELFPKDEYVDQAHKHMADCRKLLVDQELYVADFYLTRERPTSARGRLEGVVRDFEDVPEQWAVAAGQLVEVYRTLQMTPEAVAVARKLVQLQPKSAAASKARSFLKTF